MFYLGIDPGKTGGWALIDEQDNPTGKIFENYRTFFNVYYPLARAGNIRGVLEAVSAFPGQGVKSMFSFGSNYGGWLATLEIMGISYELIRPQKWQKAILGDIPKGESKERALAFAQRKWPTLDLKKKDSGVVDALCMALYAKQFHIGNIK